MPNKPKTDSLMRVFLFLLIICLYMGGCSSPKGKAPNLWYSAHQTVEILKEQADSLKEQISLQLHGYKKIRIFGREAIELDYGPDTSIQNLDLYLPESTEPAPLVVFIHGGGWMSGHKRDGQHLPWLDLVDAGYAVASLNYGLAPDAPWPQGLEDCRLAIAYLAEHGSEFHLDYSRIGLAGDSSGGHYALYLASMDDLPIACTAAWFPVTDLAGLQESITASAGDEQKESAAQMMQMYLHSIWPELNEQTMMEASPIDQLHAGMGPILLMHGDADLLVDVDQSIRYEQAARALNLDVQLKILPGAGHCDPAFETKENMAEVQAFFDTYLKAA